MKSLPPSNMYVVLEYLNKIILKNQATGGVDNIGRVSESSESSIVGLCLGKFIWISSF